MIPPNRAVFSIKKSNYNRFLNFNWSQFFLKTGKKTIIYSSVPKGTAHLQFW